MTKRCELFAFYNSLYTIKCKMDIIYKQFAPFRRPEPKGTELIYSEHYQVTQYNYGVPEHTLLLAVNSEMTRK